MKQGKNIFPESLSENPGALLTAYSYAKLSVAYPSRGGTVTLLDRAFGAGMFTGSLNVLLWLSYVVMLSLYALAFGSYSATFLPEAWHATGKHGLISLSVILITGLNLLSAGVIGKAENWIVGLKVAILLLFVGVGRVDLADGEDRTHEIVGARGDGRAGGDHRGHIPADKTGD